MSAPTAVSSVLPKARLFRGFAEPSRLLILEALRDGAKTVSQVSDATGLTQPNTSNHLACLLACGLIERRRIGRFVHYRLADDRIETFLALADEITCGATRSSSCCPVCGSDAW